MPTNYPGSLDTHPNPTSTTYQDDAGFELDVLISNLGDALDAVEAKVGTGSSNQTAAAGRVLGADGAGTSSWRKVVTADLDLNQVTQYGISDGGTSGPTTTSTSYVDLSTNSVTLTTVGGPCIVIASATLTNSSSGAVVFFAVNMDGGSSQGERTQTVTTANHEYNATSIAVFTPSSGSHTFKMRWSVNSGTGTAVGTRRTILVVELKR